MMLFSALLSVATVVGGCDWTIYAKAVLVDVALWQFSNNPPNSDSAAYTMIFLIVLHSTCTGKFSRGIAFISVLYFCPSKKSTCSAFCL